MKKVRILQVPPIRFGLVLGLINGVIGMIVAPILLFTLGAAATAADLAIAPKLLGIPWLFAGAGALFTCPLPPNAASSSSTSTSPVTPMTCLLRPHGGYESSRSRSPVRRRS
jgi:hypothetical protein